MLPMMQLQLLDADNDESRGTRHNFSCCTQGCPHVTFRVGRMLLLACNDQLERLSLRAVIMMLPHSLRGSLHGLRS